MFFSTFADLLLQKSNKTLQNTVFYDHAASLRFKAQQQKYWKRQCFLQLLLICCFKKSNKTLQNTVFYNYTASLRFKAQQQKHWKRQCFLLCLSKKAYQTLQNTSTKQPFSKNSSGQTKEPYCACASNAGMSWRSCSSEGSCFCPKTLAMQELCLYKEGSWFSSKKLRPGAAPL